MQLYDLKETKERVILVGVQADDNEDTEKSLDELEELAQTAGAETVGRIIQNREQIHPGTYVGKGKLDEIKISSGRQMPLESFVMMSSLLHNLEISRMHWIQKSWIAL
mgnify:CR=1 FL=1